MFGASKYYNVGRPSILRSTVCIFRECGVCLKKHGVSIV